MMNNKIDEYSKHIINLRQELKQEIPGTTYLTHGIHNVYPAKFIPQVPRFVTKLFNLENKIILDPFAGSGTTAVESLITGNSNISNDINPLTKFMIDVKTSKLTPNKLFYYLDLLNSHIKSIFKSSSSFIPRWGNLDYWYPEEVLPVLCKMWGGIHNVDENDAEKESIKNILKASALYVSRKYSYGEDQSPKLFKSKFKKKKIKELMKVFKEEGEELLKLDLLKKSRSYLESVISFNSNIQKEYKRVNSFNNINCRFLLVLNKSIEELDKELPEESIDCIVTSPPYVYAQEYFRSTKIDLYWLDMVNDKLVRELTRKEIGQKRTPLKDFSIELSKIKSFERILEVVKESSKNFKTKENITRFIVYFNDMLYFIHLSEKLLVKKGKLAIFIGEPKVFGCPIKTNEIITEMMINNNFKIVNTFFDVIKSRHLSRKRLNKNPDGIMGEWLIIGEKQ